MRLLPRLSALLVAIGAVAAILAAIVVERVAAARGVAGVGPVWIVPFMLAAVAAPAGVGAFVVARRPGNRVGWILVAGALAVGVVLCADAIERLELGQDRSSALGAWAGMVALEWPVFFVWPLLLAYLYPSGQLPGPRWRAPFALACVAIAGVLILLLLSIHLGDPVADVANPLPVGIEDSTWVWIFWPFFAGMLIALFGGDARSLPARAR